MYGSQEKKLGQKVNVKFYQSPSDLLRKWGANGDLILSEMGTKWGPLATEMRTKGPNGD